MNKTSYDQYDSFDPLHHPKYLKTMTYIFVPLFILISYYSNISTIIIIRNSRKAWQTFNSMIICISVCNLIITTVPPLFFLSQMISQKWNFGPVVCFSSVTLQYACLTSDRCFMIIMAYERFVAISKPLENHIKPKSVIVAMIAGIFIFSTILSILGCTFIDPNATFITGDSGCMNTWLLVPKNTSDEDKFFVVVMAYFFILFLCPTLSLVILYSKLAMKLKRVRAPGSQNNSHEDHNHSGRNKRVTMMLITTVLLFEVCWLPTWTQQLMLLTPSERKLSHQTRALIDSLVNSLSYGHAAMSPFIFPMFLIEYRHYYENQIHCLCIRPKEQARIRRESAFTDYEYRANYIRKFSTPVQKVNSTVKKPYLHRSVTDSYLPPINNNEIDLSSLYV